MSNQQTLRTLLARLDGTAPTIQAAAAAMMRHYDKSAPVAVNEWRNALQSVPTDPDKAQLYLLSLLYVANEVLQTSKRNRGSKFLEAMSPILGQALISICQRDPVVLTEKVRRTVKIWGDRRVFSVRYVSELLRGIDKFRNAGNAQNSSGDNNNHDNHANDGEQGRFSPIKELDESGRQVKASPAKPQEAHEGEYDSIGSPTAMDSDTDSDHSTTENNDIDEDDDKPLEDSDDDDDDEMFGDAASGSKLDLAIDFDTTVQENMGESGTKTKALTENVAKKRRRKTAMSISNLAEVWNRLQALQQSMTYSQMTLQKLDSSIKTTPVEELENLVGDELQAQYKQILFNQEQIVAQRQQLHGIAEERYAIEQETIRYIPWLQAAMKQDEEDIIFCDGLENKIKSFQKVHVFMKKARDERLAEEKKLQEKQELDERKRREREETERFRQEALARNSVAQPGMVWNPTTREYQELDLNESWRDN